MAGLLGKVAKFASSPQGRAAIEKAAAKAKVAANDPKNRARIDGLVAKAQSAARGKGGPRQP